VSTPRSAGRAIEQAAEQGGDYRDESSLGLGGTASGRYHVIADGRTRALVCGNASNVALRVVPGLTITSRRRKWYPARTIFLDGAFHGAPFCDNQARHYSLDHHAGCIRGFTLATCEQSVVMLLQGLALGVGDWNLYVNDPDLDSVLAAWVLMNHQDLLADGRALLKRAMPLIRLEGVIDAHGTDMEVLAALPEDVHARTKSAIDELIARERELKSAGAWHSTDWVEYTRDMLEAIDRAIVPEAQLAELTENQEAGRADIGQRIAVFVRSSEGIYAVEARLKERYGAQLGLIVLDPGSGRFTLRQVDTFLSKDLSAVYRALNRRDPAARSGGDPPNLWGGSGNIGGSPRVTGSQLDGQQVLAVIRQVLGPREPLLTRLWRLWCLLREGRSETPALPPSRPDA
jgi:hypothetical protein